MEVFDLQENVIGNYSDYIRSFLTIKDDRMHDLVEQELGQGFLWPNPLVQLNPAFEPGRSIPDLVSDGVLHSECFNVFSDKPDPNINRGPLRFHKHQEEGILAAKQGDNYVLTTGTGSGKSLSYIVPIVDHVLQEGSGRGVKAIIIYPMNALANSQLGELRKFLEHGYPQGAPVTFQRYTGQESESERQEILANPPDILLTNYVMLELILTRPRERKIIEAAQDLKFLVLDELHTYRGRQGADVAMLVRRVREATKAQDVIHVGTSATLSSEGTWLEQRTEVAQVASRLLGAEVLPENIIGESLRRVTTQRNIEDAAFITALRERIEDPNRPDNQDVEAFLEDPLPIWIESIMGVRLESDTGRLVRCKPIALSGENGAGTLLAEITNVAIECCEQALEKTLLMGYQFRDIHNHPVFAFRLHQFISKGESVYASPEPEADRHITLQAQQFVPGSERSKVLLPVAFCRECGQEYYVIRKEGGEGTPVVYHPRELTDRLDNDDGYAGFLYINTEDPWPSDGPDLLEKLPDSWIELQDGMPRVRAARRDRLPREVFVSPDGREGQGQLRAHYIKTPFPFCMNCGIDYSAYQRSDFGKLATLGSEGRSTATTVLSLTAIRKLRKDGDLSPEAQKLLSFTDNRQDASLQAGHFNDFIEIGLLRSALWRAVDQAGEEGLRHDNLTRKVFDALNLPLELYAVNPQVEFLQLEETQRALRRVLGYYLYRDLKRGWRVTSPNLEQCGLLEMDYLSLQAFCADDRRWESCHAVLATATGEEREAVCRVLLDYMRRELAIRVDYLDAAEQESIQLLSNQHLVRPWSLDELEPMERSTIVLPRPTRQGDGAGRFAHLSPRGGFGLYLKRANTFQNYTENLKTDEVQQIIVELIEALCIPGLVHRVLEPRDDQDVAGYQLNASGLVWRKGDGTKALQDPVRIPNPPKEGHRTNPFFVEFYQSDTEDIKRVEAREHTAQVPPELREEREERFRDARLPLLFCSPTMELGVDISQLNVVNMRNVPPTPANYAQRSGRAGRSGQPAFVFTYCAGGSPHDQYFFKRPENMVAGVVSTPRLDLANEDLLKAHVHAIWLSTVGLDLRSSLSDILDLSGEEPTLALQKTVRTALDDQIARNRAKVHVKAALSNAIEALVAPDGDVDEWITRVLDQVPYSFEQACRRWRGLYMSAMNQAKRQSKIIHDAAIAPQERDRARRLRAEAEAQLALLLESGNRVQSDFYSYRYFASEGFLPGYNFPRLPLSAYLPGRRRRSGSDEFLSRPRFLAISEFGPRAIIYHEGSRYVINKVILPIDGEGTELTRRAVQCEACGYIHPLGDEPAPDLCEHCHVGLPLPYENLFWMQNVATRRRDRINSDEEERFRLGYEIKTGVRFAERGGTLSKQLAVLKDSAGEESVRILYGHSATLWRLNMGWKRRKNQDQLGYILDTERGFWARNQAVADDDPDDPMSASTERVIPYVEDRRNCILLEPVRPLSVEMMASLQAGLKAAIQVYFQLEDNELAAEPLPDAENRRQIVLYESAEGGAGVLHRLVEDAQVLPNIARLALDLCHFDPDSGTDLGRAPNAREDCDAACYDCLLSYYNQQDHRLLDRKLLLPILSQWMNGSVITSPKPVPRDELVARFKRLADSELEKKWIDLVDGLNLRLPSDSQVLVSECQVSLDFFYADPGVAIFIDGPPHDSADQQARDRQQRDCLDANGYHVIAFHHEDDWGDILRQYPSIFGTPTTVEDSVASTSDAEIDLDLFDSVWHSLITALAEAEGVSITAGGDVMHQERVVGVELAIITFNGNSVHMIDQNGPDFDTVKQALLEQEHTVVAVSQDNWVLDDILNVVKG